MVDFGKSKFLTGVIYALRNEPDVRTLRPIKELLDGQPILPEDMFPFLGWLGKYYMCTLGEVLKAALPSGFRLSSESTASLMGNVDTDQLILSEQEEWIVRYLQEKDFVVAQLAHVTGLKNITTRLKSLQERGVIQIIEKAKDKYVPKRESRIRLKEALAEETQLDELLIQLEKKPKQVDVIVNYLQLADVLTHIEKNAYGIRKKDLLDAPVSPSSLKTLIQKGVFEEWQATVDRFASAFNDTAPPPELSAAQELARDQVKRAFEEKNTVLLKGVTGSGKTAIFMDLIQEEANKGNRALYLLPEIALTTQIIQRFRKIFGNRFGVYHSRFSDNERVDVWKSCLQGKYDFVIGVRSSIFLPIPNLSLIIVDEEHETSYKQQDPAPRYNARDAAIYRASLTGANVLLSTATPSLESYKNALENKYGQVELTERYQNQPTPSFHLLNMAKERSKKSLKGSFASEMIAAIEEAKTAGKQILLFQNRRGYAPYLLCQNCGHSPKCPNCSVSLTYHIFHQQLKCHYCGYFESIPGQCESCGHTDLKAVGSGTEKIEEELAILMPDLKIQRMDLDSTRSKFAYQDIIDRFESKEIDVLVGTQMISKGLDFDDVTLVGVFDVDRQLHFPDFRSHERTFHLVTQVGGRSGRKNEQGKVLVQTNDPDQRLLRHIVNEDFETFYQEEIAERQKFKYPPFYRLIVITVRHRDKDVAYGAATQFGKSVRIHLSTRVSEVIEPVINRIRNLYRFQIIVRVEQGGIQLTGVKQLLLTSKDTLLALPAFKSVKVHFDVDPL